MEEEGREGSGPRQKRYSKSSLILLRVSVVDGDETMTFSFQFKLVATAALCISANALVPNANHHLPNTRREVLGGAASSLLLVAPVVMPNSANALEGCGRAAHNCIRTSWVAPSSISTAAEVAQTIRDVLNTYPQTGQSGVDCNGWRIVKDDLESDAAIITLEFKSCVGPAALAINLGQPFIDDLKLELGKDASGSMTVSVLSKSRMGSSDLFVNRKRLMYLGNKLKEKGWNVPDPKYPYET